MSTIHFYYNGGMFMYYPITQKTALSTGLVAYYPFNGTFNDASGNGHTGSPIGGVYSTTDRFGNPFSAMEFRSNESGYIDCPPAVYFNSDFTISSWVKINDHNNWQNLLDFGTGTTNNVIFGLSYGTSGQPDFKIRNGSNETYLNPNVEIQVLC
jgi:hypothetical protein